MKEKDLVNEYGSRYGTELIFDTFAEMKEYEAKHYPDGGFPQSNDIWNQIRVSVIEKYDPDSLIAKLKQSGKTDNELIAMGFNI